MNRNKQNNQKERPKSALPNITYDMLKKKWSTNDYLNFFRYSILIYHKNNNKNENNPEKAKPVFNNYKNTRTNTNILNRIKQYQVSLKNSCSQHLTLSYTPEKLVTGSSLSPYTGDAISLLHPLYGVPYIEASSIKGILRHCFIHERYNGEQTKALRDPLFQKMFGINDKEEKKYVQGQLIFFDSYPEGKYTFERDIQTPHYSEYYGSEGQIMPTDDKNPIPFQFYVVKNTTFLIHVGITSSFSPKETDMIQQLLTIALEDYGLGGKTAVGYGLGKVSKIQVSKTD